MIADANTFVGNDIGIVGAGCGAVQSYAANKFVSGYRGIVLISNTAQYFEALSNTFDGSTLPFMGVGIHMGSGSVIAKLNDNTFTNISFSAAATMNAGISGYAIIMGGWDIIQAQRNSIHDNDNGLWVQNTMQQTFFSVPGTINDGNSFYCNSSMSNGIGYDVLASSSVGNTPLDPFKGAHFDHSPPTQTFGTNGSDLIVGNAMVVANSSGAVVNQKCAAGRVQ